MKQRRFNNSFLAFLFILGITIGRLKSQEMPKLQIGDAAPALTYSKWIQGENPVTKFDNKKLYVVEFWATWCGPCIAAMPHLSELANNYKGKIDFIACDVWENKYGGAKEQESYTDKVSNFVKDQYKLGRLTYNVIMDNNAQDMANNWLKAAGLGGIPSSFIVKDGKIAWIGHPYYLDSILTSVVDGKYDFKVEREKRVQEIKAQYEREKGPNEALKAYKEAEAAKQYERALNLMNDALIKYPENNYMFLGDKFFLLMDHFSIQKALEFGKEISKEKLPGEVLIAYLYPRENLPNQVSEFAIGQINKWKIDNNPKVYEILSSFQAKLGKYEEAVKSLKAGLELGLKMKDNPAFTETTASEYRTKIQLYEQKAKKIK